MLICLGNFLVLVKVVMTRPFDDLKSFIKSGFVYNYLTFFNDNVPLIHFLVIDNVIS